MGDDARDTKPGRRKILERIVEWLALHTIDPNLRSEYLEMLAVQQSVRGGDEALGEVRTNLSLIVSAVADVDDVSLMPIGARLLMSSMAGLLLGFLTVAADPWGVGPVDIRYHLFNIGQFSYLILMFTWSVLLLVDPHCLTRRSHIFIIAGLCVSSLAVTVGIKVTYLPADSFLGLGTGLLALGSAVLAFGLVKKASGLVTTGTMVQVFGFLGVGVSNVLWIIRSTHHSFIAAISLVFGVIGAGAAISAVFSLGHLIHDRFAAVRNVD